jgi:hypothetical protein
MHDALAAVAKVASGRGAADAALGNGKNRPLLTPSVFPPDARAVIHCPAPSVISSGRTRAAEWVLEFERRTPPFIEPLMGWTGSTDMLSHIRLRFPNREAAVAYAERQGLCYEIREPTHIRADDLARERQRIPDPGHRLSLETAWAGEVPHLAPHQIKAANHQIPAA